MLSYLCCPSISILIWTTTETLHLAAIPTLPAPPTHNHNSLQTKAVHSSLILLELKSSVLLQK